MRLSKESYKVSEAVDATIVFRNNGLAPIKVPVIRGEGNVLFFDFLAVGTFGTQFLTSHAEAWREALVKDVRLVRLDPGKTHEVQLKNVLPLTAFDAGIFVTEQFTVVAIYRDHSYGHSATYPEFGKQDPAVWRGVAISNPVTISQIVEDRPPPKM